MSNVYWNATVSVGLTASSPVMGLALDDLVRAADEALYAAKRSGRNSLAVSSSKPGTRKPKTLLS